ncbi:hypothetical protein ACFSKS_01665 [Pseudocitrobacter faecalis]
MEQDVKSILTQAGMKERDISFLLRLAKKKTLASVRLFFCMPGNIMLGAVRYY